MRDDTACNKPRVYGTVLEGGLGPCARWGMFAASVHVKAAGSHEHNSNPEAYIVNLHKYSSL